MELKLNKELQHFLVVGVLSTVIQYSVLSLIIELGLLLPVMASVVAYVFGAITNYCLNYYLTFKSSNKHWHAVPKFMVVTVFGLIFNVAIFNFFITFLHYLLAQGIATFIVIFWNYLFNKYWTFKSRQLVH